jgi:TPR repeat protein
MPKSKPNPRPEIVVVPPRISEVTADSLISSGREEFKKKNYQLSAELFRRAAVEFRDPVAQRLLGRLYKDGLGVIQDESESKRWSQKAFGQFLERAKQGDAKSQNALGEMYQEAEGVSRDYTEAFGWYSRACEQAFPAAQRNLGMMYWNGIKPAGENRAKAILLLQLAAKQNDAQAQNILRVSREEW